MPRRRYTVLIADRSTGVLRRVTISLRTAMAVVTTVLMMPVLIGLGAKWSARDEIGQLQATTAALQVENGNFRQTTGELTTQIQSLENVIDDLGAIARDGAVQGCGRIADPVLHIGNRREGGAGLDARLVLGEQESQSRGNETAPAACCRAAGRFAGPYEPPSDARPVPAAGQERRSPGAGSRHSRRWQRWRDHAWFAGWPTPQAG